MSSHFSSNDPSVCSKCTQLKDWLTFPFKLGHSSSADETFCQEEDYILDLASPLLRQQCLHQDFTQEYDSLHFLIKSQLLLVSGVNYFSQTGAEAIGDLSLPILILSPTHNPTLKAVTV